MRTNRRVGGMIVGGFAAAVVLMGAWAAAARPSEQPGTLPRRAPEAVASPAEGEGPAGQPERVARYVVPAGEVRRVDRDLVVHALGEIVIDGELIGRDGVPGGPDGVSITLVANGRVVINGKSRWGAGLTGSSRTLSAAEAGA